MKDFFESPRLSSYWVTVTVTDMARQV